MSHLSWSAAAGMFAFDSALTAFRYRSAAKYYDGAKIGDDTNWYKLTDMIRNYAGVAVGGIISLSSLMAAFGIAKESNSLIWMVAIVVWFYFSSSLSLVRLFAYDAAYTHA